MKFDDQLFATAIASPNIALIKYWGNRDDVLNIPSNGSISITLANLVTKTTVVFSPEYSKDTLILDSIELSGQPAKRATTFLDEVRNMSGISFNARVTSENNFPMGTGIASSASAFAALALAATSAAGLQLNDKELSILARKGSGSACRSIFGGFVEWVAGNSDQTSYAKQLCASDHWELVDLVTIVDTTHKRVTSKVGHQSALTSPLQATRIADAPHRLDLCRNAILSKDFELLADIVELDCNMMHAVMITSNPPLLYWQPATINIIKEVKYLRSQGIPVCYTIDAGPNVHVIVEKPYKHDVLECLNSLDDVVEIISSKPGGGAKIINNGST